MIVVVQRTWRHYSVDNLEATHMALECGEIEYDPMFVPPSWRLRDRYYYRSLLAAGQAR